MTQPWFGWPTEYPDEGSVIVDANGPDEAMKKAREELNADDGTGDIMRVSVRIVQAKDVENLRDELEKLKVGT